MLNAIASPAGGAVAPAPSRPDRAGTASVSGSTPEARLLAVLAREPATVDTLAARAGLTVPEVLGGLLALQWAGIAKPSPGQRWQRNVT